MPVTWTNCSHTHTTQSTDKSFKVLTNSRQKVFGFGTQNQRSLLKLLSYHLDDFYSSLMDDLLLRMDDL